MPKRREVVFALSLIAGLLFLAWWITPDTNNQRATGRPDTFSSPTEKLDYDVTTKLGALNRSEVADRVTVQWSEPDGELTVDFAGNDNFGNTLVVNGLLTDTLVVAKACRESSIPFKTLNVSGTMPIQDKYGNASETRVSLVCFSRQTLTLMNFDNLRADDVERAADSFWASPLLAD